MPARPERSEEELLNDLNNWERYLQPGELEELERRGIRKEVLNDIFITVRYKNRTFGVEDQAIRNEKLRPYLQPGQHFRDFVRNYITILKKVARTEDTEDEPMNYTRLLFSKRKDLDSEEELKDIDELEEIDPAIFESEAKRIDEILEKMKTEGRVWKQWVLIEI